MSVQYRQFLKDVMGVHGIGLPQSGGWVWVPSQVRLYCLDFGNVRWVKTFQLLVLCHTKKGLGGTRLLAEDRETEMLPAARKVSAFAQTSEVPDEVVASRPQVADDLSEVSGSPSNQIGIDIIDEPNLAESIYIAIGPKTVALGFDDRLTGIVESCYVVASPIEAHKAVVQRGLCHYSKPYAARSEGAS